MFIYLKIWVFKLVEKRFVNFQYSLKTLCKNYSSFWDYNCKLAREKNMWVIIYNIIHIIYIIFSSGSKILLANSFFSTSLTYTFMKIIFTEI